jgi:hypothetical protein
MVNMPRNDIYLMYSFVMSDDKKHRKTEKKFQV